MGLTRWIVSISTAGLVSGRSNRTKQLVELRKINRTLNQKRYL